MNLYNKHVLPKLINWTCSQKPNMVQRQKIIPLASGNVLEIGIGSGLNLPFYNQQKVKHLMAIDPFIELWDKNLIETKNLSFEFEFIEGVAENIPVSDNSFDSIVVTYTLCSIVNTTKAFDEIRRVLKADGKLIFCEHGLAPEKTVRRYQNFINPLWKQLSGGCTLNRDIPSMIENNGLSIETLEATYIPGWRPASYNFMGTARLGRG